MRLLAGVVLAALVVAAPAQACPTAPSATRVGVIASKPNQNPRRSVLRVCGVVLARGLLRERENRPWRGTEIGAASAAGNRVAWIETRHSHGVRTITVHLVAVGRRVRELRAFTVRREHTFYGSSVDVLLTRQGDLAWSAGTYDGPGEVVVEQPGKPRRRLASYEGFKLHLDDGRTLRWSDGFVYDFFDLRQGSCTQRRSTVLARTDRFLVTRRIYGVSYFGTWVFRGCDLATGRDHVIAQQYSDYSETAEVALVGVDRTWALFRHTAYDRDGCVTPQITVANALTGETRRTSLAKGCEGVVPTAEFAITERGVAAFLSQGALWAGNVELDRGAIADLHAAGDAVLWTNDGIPRRAVP